jgi:hypothetical protein
MRKRRGRRRVRVCMAKLVTVLKTSKCEKMSVCGKTKNEK